MLTPLSIYIRLGFHSRLLARKWTFSLHLSLTDIDTAILFDNLSTTIAFSITNARDLVTQNTHSGTYYVFYYNPLCKSQYNTIYQKDRITPWRHNSLSSVGKEI